MLKTLTHEELFVKLECNVINVHCIGLFFFFALLVCLSQLQSGQDYPITNPTGRTFIQCEKERLNKFNAPHMKFMLKEVILESLQIL